MDIRTLVGKMGYFQEMICVLVDCNNFYVSCERLFNPALEGRPVIVLSNNDGCVVSRSQEAKQLGIAMGEPFFKIRDLCTKKKVAVYSSNYQLYGDLSGRVMTVLSSMNPDLQIYSIDEAFLRYPSTIAPEQVVAQCVDIRRIIKQWIGIPTSLGIASTKTLAKVATKLAKKCPGSGVVDLTASALQEEVLKVFPIREVWGIGARLEEKFHALGMRTAWDLCSADPTFIRRQIGVVGERMVWELRGISCLPLEEASSKKSISCSRSFGERVTDLDTLAQAVSSHVALACEKLRSQGSCASAMSVYVAVLADSKTGERRYFESTASFPIPTNSTPVAIRAAKERLSHLFLTGQQYKKCGVVMMGLVPESSVAPDLFLGGVDPRSRHVADVVDSINAQFGRDTLFYGATGAVRRWTARSEWRSRRYTTCWDELAEVKA